MSFQSCTADYQPGMHTTALWFFMLTQIFLKMRKKDFSVLVGLLSSKHGLIFYTFIFTYAGIQIWIRLYLTCAGMGIFHWFIVDRQQRRNYSKQQ